MVKDRFNNKGSEFHNKNTIKINKQLDTTNADGNVLQNLLNYMQITEKFNKRNLDNMTTQKSFSVKSLKNL